MSCARLLALLLAAPASGQSDLYYTEDVSPEDWEWYGFSVASAGDVDGDGFDDYIAGAPRDYTSGPLGPGSASVHSGLSGLRLLLLQGSQNVDRFGWAVAGVGDVDGDGHDDVIVGAPLHEAGAVGGRVQVFSGLDGALLFTLDGGTAYAELGRAVAGGGDIDGDGTPDFVAAETYGDRGRVHLISGPAGPVIRVIEGQPGDGLGWTVADAGDVDGDGRADVLVGARGFMRVYDGVTGGILYEWTGATELFGRQVAGGHDLDGDGVPDILTSDQQANGSRGYLRAYSGATGGLLRQWDGTPASSLGRTVAFGGDLDGDGVQDVVASTNSAAAPVRVFSGNGSYAVQSELIEEGYAPLALLRDVTGDGLPELLVGGPETSFIVDPQWEFGAGRVLCTTFHAPGPGVPHCFGDGSLADCPCGGGAPVFQEDFEGGSLPPGWTATDAWHVTSACNGALCGGNVVQGSFAYFGNSTTCDISGTGVGSLTTPPIQLPDVPDLDLVAEFRQVLRQDSEVHRAFVHLLNASGQILRTWDYSAHLNPYDPPTCGDPSTLDLNAFKGLTVRLQWFFFHDGFITTPYIGWQVDAVTVRLLPNNAGGREGCRNSTGGGGMLLAGGTTSAAADDLVLTAAQVPPGNSAIFFVGDTTFNPPFAVGNGLSCTGGSSHRYPPVNTGSGAVSLTQPVAGSLGLIQAGGTYGFQFWFRDTSPVDCTAGSNLTHAYSVTFGP